MPTPRKSPTPSRGRTKRPAASRSHSGPRKFRAAEFFAGIGLVRLALEKTGDWQVVYANDIDPDKKKMYADNFGEAVWRSPTAIAQRASSRQSP